MATSHRGVDGETAEDTVQNVLKKFVSLLGNEEATPAEKRGAASRRKPAV